MVVTGAVLFLIGTINSFTIANPLQPTEILVEKHINPAFAEKLTNYGLQSGLPPFISNFMQHGTNIFFKPQFMVSPTYASSDRELIIESKEDCKKLHMIPAIPFAAQPQIAMDEPLKIIETIVSDGEPPVVDKVVVIKPSMQPLGELADHPILISPLPEPALDVPLSSPVVFSDTPVLPPLPLIPVPAINTSANGIPETIPAAPELPTLEIPQVPVFIDEPVEIPMVEIVQPAITEEIKPIPVPETQELLPVPELEALVPSLPSTPALPVVPIPAAPELPPLEVPQAPVVLNEPMEVSQPAVIEEIKPVLVPESFELPSPPVLEILVPSLPPMPSFLPAALEPEPKPEPVPYVEVYENHIPLHIPEAPELPPYSPPTLPVPIILPESTKECDRTSALVETPTLVHSQTPIIEIHSETVQIPEAPILPEAEISEAFIAPLNPQALIEEVEPVIIPKPPVPPSPAVTFTDIIVPQPAPEPNVVEIRPVEPSVIPEVIVTLQEPILTEQVEPTKPIAIPSPPELPPLSMPDLPISVVVSEPIDSGESLLVEPQPIIKEEPVLQSLEINAPPVLPPMVPITFPEVPAFPLVHDSPVIIAESSPFEHEIISNEIPLAEVSESVLPVAIPQAPLLPPAPAIPLPVASEELSMTNEEAEPVAKPLIIPPAPELPPLSFQPMPIPLEEPVMGLYHSAELTPVIIEEPKLPQLEISNAPLYMTFAEPPKSSIIISSPMAPAPLPIVIPQQVEIADKIESPVLSKIESVISFPTTCVKNIVIERVLPNIVREGIKVVSSPSPNYPVLAPFSSTFGIRLY